MKVLNAQTLAEELVDRAVDVLGLPSHEDYGAGVFTLKQDFASRLAEVSNFLAWAQNDRERDLERELVITRQELKAAHEKLDKGDIYSRAWAREIGPPYRVKSHAIDSLVLTTRDRMQELARFRALEARGILCLNCGRPHHTADCDQP